MRSDADSAVTFALTRPSADPGVDVVAIKACGDLARRVGRLGDQRPGWSPDEIGRIISMVRCFVPAQSNTPRPQTVNEGDWSSAGELEDILWRMLTEDPAPAATVALETLADNPTFAAIREMILRFRNEQASRSADIRPWRAQDVREFEKTHELDPRDDIELFRIGLKRLNDIKADVERSDTGLRSQLRAGDDERQLRIWLANELVRRGNRRYVVPQEAVIDREQRPDIRLEHPNTDPVSIEIKCADGRSVSNLIEGLESQLVGQYLRARRSRCGIYVVGLLDDQHWLAADGQRLEFRQVADILSSKADEIAAKTPSRDKLLAVVTIDFREQSHRGTRHISDCDFKSSTNP